nr:MBL fold metallo-hydrolase [uncultured Ruminococcus sp.]
MKSKGTILLVLCLLITTVTCGCDVSDNTQVSYSGLTVSFIDIGQGDSILLQCKDESMLIDAGENDKGDTVVNYLESHNATNLKYAVGTHPHSDHIGGMDTVLKNIQTDTLICPKVTYNSKTWKDVETEAKSQNTKIEYANAGESYTLGDATFTIISPKKNHIYSNCNNYSVVIKADYGENSFLFTGDAEKLVEDEILESNYNIKADVLKVGHHGSSTSSSEKFLNKVSPKYAVISCGVNNEYGHPHKETLEKLKERNIKTYRTDLEGTVVAQSDGKEIRFSTEKNNSSNIKTETYATKGNKGTTISKEKFIGNKNSKKFHKPNCDSVYAMSDKNKVYFDNRKDALYEGYTPCKSCNP